MINKYDRSDFNRACLFDADEFQQIPYEEKVESVRFGNIIAGYQADYGIYLYDLTIDVGSFTYTGSNSDQLEIGYYILDSGAVRVENYVDLIEGSHYLGERYLNSDENIRFIAHPSEEQNGLLETIRVSFKIGSQA